tara:strand:+ start:281 stop:460 length:180 start_codon:yes stop_codon:yes gene_type:complete
MNEKLLDAQKLLDALALAQLALAELSDERDGDDPIFSEGGSGYEACAAIRDIFAVRSAG